MELLETSIETFPAEHPAIHGRMLLERARVALSLHHESPAAVHFRHPTDEQEARVRFAAPDPRSMHTLDREKFAEEGAIVMAGILLQHY